MKSFQRAMRCLPLILLGIFSLGAETVAPRLVVKSVAGSVRTFGQDSAIVHGPVQGEILQTESEIRTGDGGKIVLRFHPDHAYLDAREKSAFSVRYG
jgi:hypothetical protein